MLASSDHVLLGGCSVAGPPGCLWLINPAHTMSASKDAARMRATERAVLRDTNLFTCGVIVRYLSSEWIHSLSNAQLSVAVKP